MPGDRSRPWRASVSAVPRSYIEHMMNLLRIAGITTLSFETIPRAIARLVSGEKNEDSIVIHVMERKTGVYIISQNAVGFTSTIQDGRAEADIVTYTDTLAAEVRRVYNYWFSKNEGEDSAIKQVIIIGREAEMIASTLRGKVTDIVPVHAIDVWRSVINTSRYVPPISKSDSYEYAPAVGLAL